MRRSSSFNIPAYAQNAVLQLVVASGSGFVMYHLIRVTLIVFGFKEFEAAGAVAPLIGIADIHHFPTHCWTILTYGWVHNGFWEWFTDMIWLYWFGSALQMIVGYRQVIPVYIYGLLAGGVFCLLAQLIPGGAFALNYPLMTGQAGVMALAAAALTISPKYRFYLSEHFSIPLVVVAAIYLVLTLATHRTPPLLMLSAGGLLAGFLCMRALKRGIQPGGWMQNIYTKLSAWVAPKDDLSQRANSRRNIVINSLKNNAGANATHIDELLDKINQRGYNSLTKQERELLIQASKDTK